MKKLIVWGSALAIALMSAPVMAVDFHALTGVQTAPAPIQDTELSATEGGAACSISTATSVGGGAALCLRLAPKTPSAAPPPPINNPPIISGPLSGLAILIVI